MFQLLAGLVEPIISKVFGSKEERDKASHEENMQKLSYDSETLKQFSSEFKNENKTFLDSMINSLNRLPRPLFALWVFWVICVWPFIDLMSWKEYISIFALIPEGLVALFGIVITFFFGGRMQIKSQSFKQTAQQIDLMNKMITAKEADDKISDDDYYKELADDSKPMSNKAIMEWNRRKNN